MRSSYLCMWHKMLFELLHNKHKSFKNYGIATFIEFSSCIFCIFIAFFLLQSKLILSRVIKCQSWRRSWRSMENIRNNSFQVGSHYLLWQSQIKSDCTRHSLAYDYYCSCWNEGLISWNDSSDLLLNMYVLFVNLGWSLHATVINMSSHE